MSKFKLKNLKVNEAMSEETVCFSAKLYENGKFVAYISNRGQGGSNDIYPAEGLTYKDVAYLDNLETECEISTLVIEMNIIHKNQNNAFILKKDKKIYTSKINTSFSKLKKTHPNYKEQIKKEINLFKAKGYEILNTNL